MFTTTEATPIQREVIMPKVREFLNTATITLKFAERDPQVNPDGNFIITYNKEMNNNAASGRPEADGTSASDLPAARASKYGRTTIPSRQLYTSAKWTGKVIAATQSKESLVNALVEETKRAALKSKTSVNRQLLGDGRDALAFYVSGATATTGIVAGEVGGRASDFLEAGDTLCDLVDVSGDVILQTLIVRRGTAVATGRNVSFFNATTGAAVALNASAATGDHLVLAGTRGTVPLSTRNQLMGLDGIINDANTPIEGAAGLQGVPVATIPEFAAISQGAYATPLDLSVSDMQAVLGELDIQGGGDIGGAEGIKLILTSQRGKETVEELFRSERIKVNTMELDGGFTGVSFNGQYPIVADKHCKLQTFYFWNPESTKLFVLKDWDWEDKDGSMFFRINGSGGGAGGQDALGATLKAYIEFGVIVRNANGVLRGVNMIR